MLSDLTEWVTDIIEAIGYVGVALLVAIENVFPPIPSEVVLPFAGFVASDGDANLVGMVVAATVGSMVGAYALYGLSAWIGQERLHYLIARHGRWARLSVADVEKAEAWFDKRGPAAVLIGRCVPLIRSLVSIPAGFGKMPLGTFSLFTLIGSAAWNTALIGAGYLLRDQWEDVEPVMEKAQYAVILAFLVAGLAYLWVKFLSPAARSGETKERARDAEVIADWEAKRAERAERPRSGGLMV
jgi:membrane protein DedA with SNARE-associated domain